jgi:hypothetical protein
MNRAYPRLCIVVSTISAAFVSSGSCDSLNGVHRDQPKIG